MKGSRCKKCGIQQTKKKRASISKQLPGSLEDGSRLSLLRLQESHSLQVKFCIQSAHVSVCSGVGESLPSGYITCLQTPGLLLPSCPGMGIILYSEG